jgi:transposase-like protein
LCGLTGLSMVAGRRTAVTRRRHTPEQIIRKLAEGQKLVAGGATVEQVCRQFQIAESTWARWLNQYGGMKADDAKRLKELESENTELKRLLAEAELDKAMLKRLAEAKW